MTTGRSTEEASFDGCGDPEFVASPSSGSSNTGHKRSRGLVRRAARTAADNLTRKQQLFISTLQQEIQNLRSSLASGDTVDSQRARAIMDAFPFVDAEVRPPPVLALRRSVAAHFPAKLCKNLPFGSLSRRQLRRIQKGFTVVHPELVSCDFGGTQCEVTVGSSSPPGLAFTALEPLADDDSDREETDPWPTDTSGSDEEAEVFVSSMQLTIAHFRQTSNSLADQLEDSKEQCQAQSRSLAVLEDEIIDTFLDVSDSADGRLATNGTDRKLCDIQCAIGEDAGLLPLASSDNQIATERARCELHGSLRCRSKLFLFCGHFVCRPGCECKVGVTTSFKGGSEPTRFRSCGVVTTPARHDSSAAGRVNVVGKCYADVVKGVSESSGVQGHSILHLLRPVHKHATRDVPLERMSGKQEKSESIGHEKTSDGSEMTHVNEHKRELGHLGDVSDSMNWVAFLHVE